MRLTDTVSLKWLVAALAVALGLTWLVHQGAPSTNAGAVELAIGKQDRVTAAFIGGACFDVLDDSNTSVEFSFCDDDVNDLDPTAGGIIVNIATPCVLNSPFVCHVKETVAPSGYNLKDEKHICDFSAVPFCFLTVFNDPKGSVGGVAQLPEVAGGRLESERADGGSAVARTWIVALAAVAAVGAGMATWYVRRRTR